MDNRLKQAFEEASSAILLQQENPDYESEFTHIQEEIEARSANYLGKLESAQATSISRLRNALYRI